MAVDLHGQFGGEWVNPFTPGDFAKKRVLKLVEWFSGHCRAIKNLNVKTNDVTKGRKDLDPHGRLRAVQGRMG